MAIKRLTTEQIRLSKQQTTPLVCLTAYTAPMAKILDNYCDILLVGDTVGMVIYGMDSTLPVTVDMIIAHGTAVTRGSRRACVVVDMPFGSYQPSPAVAFTNAAKILSHTACQAVKLEGGVAMAETINFLVQRGIPVMAHIGLQPQSVNVYGHYGARGKSQTEQERLIEDAKAVEQAGAFAVVLENIPKSLADTITSILTIPTIGIGASPNCNGQILVTEDILSMSEKSPRFAKQYTHLPTAIAQAVSNYANDVKTRVFPGEEHY